MNYPRKNYEMTEADLDKILDACKPTVAMKIGNYTGSSPQENANRAWAELGTRMGFDSMTVEPVRGREARFFTAVPSETEEQRISREANEAAYKRTAELATLRAEIADRQKRLEELGAP